MTTPYFVIDVDAIERNLKVLRSVMDETGCKILLAQKCFSCYALYPLLSQYLVGATASGLYEARLCHEEWKGGENHIFSPAYREQDIEEIFRLCNHIVFNSPRQYELYAERAHLAGLQVGLRINPECSTQEGHAIYDPCAPGSRLGTPLSVFKQYDAEMWHYLDGLHFHTLCEQNSDDLVTTLEAVESKFGDVLKGMKWINFGGGHHITRSDYDLSLLKECISRMQNNYGLQVYIEPGEAVALNAGELHSTILEIQPEGADGIRNVIVDTSAACHMPDVIEMPYTPPLMGAEAFNTEKGALSHIYRLGGPTCLSGDVIGTYSFQHKLEVGEKLVFQDMAIYSMVKTNTFNGMPLPDIYLRKDGVSTMWKHFDYGDFKLRV